MLGGLPNAKVAASCGMQGDQSVEAKGPCALCGGTVWSYEPRCKTLDGVAA
jgi:hypothetical protein